MYLYFKCNMLRYAMQIAYSILINSLHLYVTAKPFLSKASKNMSQWGNICFYLVVIINLMLALFYPFENNPVELPSQYSGILWAGTFISLAAVLMFPKMSVVMSCTFIAVFRLRFTLGVVPTLLILGVMNVIILTD